METQSQRQLLRFLQEDLGIPSEALRISLRRARSSVGSLPMVLWQYGLIDREQLGELFDWLEAA